MDRRNFVGRTVGLVGVAAAAMWPGSQAKGGTPKPKSQCRKLFRVPVRQGEKYDEKYVKTVEEEVRKLMGTEPPKGMEIAVVWSWYGRDEERITVERVRCS